MTIHLRPATPADTPFLADVVIRATLAHGRFPDDIDLAAYRADYEAWTQETIQGAIPHCTLSVIEQHGTPIGRLRVLRDGSNITLAGIQLLPDYQNQGIGTTLLNQLKQEADHHQIPLYISSVEKDNSNALRFYTRLGCVVHREDAQGYHLLYTPAIMKSAVE